MKRFVCISVFLLILITGCDAPAEVSVTKQVPADVNVGETFNFTIVVRNDDVKQHELRSVDIGTGFLEGVAVLSVTPAVREEYDVFGDHIFEFKSSLAGKAETNVVFTAKAVKSGDFSGDLDVCIDGDASCLSNSIRVIIN